MNSPQCAVKLFLKASDLGWSFQLQRCCHYLNRPHKKIWGSDNFRRLGQNGRDPGNKQSSCIFTAHCHPQTAPTYIIWPSYSAMEMTKFWRISVLAIALKVCHLPHLGTGDDTKTDEFSEEFQTAFDFFPPPTFSENHVANFIQFHAQKSCLKVQDLKHDFSIENLLIVSTIHLFWYLP